MVCYVATTRFGFWIPDTPWNPASIILTTLRLSRPGIPFSELFTLIHVGCTLASNNSFHPQTLNPDCDSKD